MNLSKTSLIFGALCFASVFAVRLSAQDDLESLLGEEPEEVVEDAAAGVAVEDAVAEEPVAEVAEETPVAEAEVQEVAEPAPDAEGDTAELLDGDEGEEPAAVEEPVVAETEEPAVVEEPVVAETEEPAVVEEPVVAETEEPAVVEEPVVAETEEPAVVEEPVVAETEEPAVVEEPVVAETEEPAVVEEPVVAETEEPAVAEEPVVAETEEPAVAEEPVVAETEEPAVVVEEPVEVVADDEEPALDAPAPRQSALAKLAAAKAVEPAAAEPVAETVPATDSEVEPAPAMPVAVAEVEPAAVEPVAETVPATGSEVAPAPAMPVAVADPFLSDVMEAEKVRFSSLYEHGLDELEQARAAMGNRKWDDALQFYKLAGTHLKQRRFQREITQGQGEANYQLAKIWLDRGDLNRALKHVEAAVEFEHPRAARLREDIKEKQNAKIDDEKALIDVVHRRNAEEYKRSRDTYRRRLRKSAQFLAVGDLNNALDQCQLVLRDDPYNTEAIDLHQRIQRRRDIIVEREREATRRGMMADIGMAWRPVYAVDASDLPETGGATSKIPLSGDGNLSIEQDIEARMKKMKLPSIAFRPPTTIIDAVDFFRKASQDFDDPEKPLDERGFNFVLDIGKPIAAAAGPVGEEDDGGFAAAAAEAGPAGGSEDIPVIPNISASNISLYEALKLVCQITNFKFKVQGSVVMVMPKSKSTEELVTRSYNVLESFLERVNGAAGDVQDAGGDFGGGGNEAAADDEARWKKFFETMGVEWPDRSRIIYIKTIGKLRVTNTAENLASLEQALSELNVTPMLIEIETRFVEVAQEDLNSLGFEWLLNSDYSLSAGRGIGKILGLKGSGTAGTSSTTSSSTVDTGSAVTTIGGVTTVTPSSRTTTTSSTHSHRRSYTVNSIDGTNYSTGQRYLSTQSNPISGEGASTNDQFMKVNAFIGNADLSMILHMLSQRSDTDLLSAPKVVTRSGQEAVMKVVTEYIYPTDYDVQLQSSSSSGNSNSSSQSAILAIVEPQNFTMREVGVILQVTPEVSAEGAMINLDLHPSVVDEPTWKNYGMRIPYSGNSSSLQSFQGIGEIFSGVVDIFNTLGTQVSDEVKSVFAQNALDAATEAMNALGEDSNMTYYDVPMEQPFFSQRSIDTHISIYNGATVVMGGLITEQRKSMEDKIPFLGDIPFIGRLFRSRSEWSSKRNLLIFVTARLVDPRGRAVTMGRGDDTGKDGAVTPVPKEN